MTTIFSMFHITCILVVGRSRNEENSYPDGVGITVALNDTLKFL